MTAHAAAQARSTKAIYKSDSEPPPEGEEGYDAPTKLGPMTKERVAEMMRRADACERIDETVRSALRHREEMPTPIDGLLNAETMPPPPSGPRRAQLATLPPPPQLPQPLPKPPAATRVAVMANKVVVTPPPIHTAHIPTPLPLPPSSRVTARTAEVASPLVFSVPPSQQPPFIAVQQSLPRRRNLVLEVGVGMCAFLMIVIPVLYVLFRTHE